MRQLQSDGYIVITGCIQHEQIAAIRADISKVFSNFDILGCQPESLDTLILATALADFEVFKAAAAASQRLLSVTALTTTISALSGLDLPAIGMRPSLLFSHPTLATHKSYWHTPPHQDWASIGGSLNALTFWVPLCALDANLGYLEVSPGSHLNHYQSEPFGPAARIIDPPLNFEPAILTAGDALMMSGFTVHRSGLNRTTKVRLTAVWTLDDLSQTEYVDRRYAYNFAYTKHQRVVSRAED